MKAFLFTCLIIASYARVSAQENYTYADSKVLQIPKAETYAASSISKYILDHFKTEKEKIRAAYTWIINNVEYSKDSMYHFNKWGTDPEVKMTAILRRRKGVCENYAELFAYIVSKCGVQAVTVTGYTKIGGTVYNTGHGWVAVYVDSAWLLCDPTWDAGRYNSYHYFLVAPPEFISSHMPFDPMWQLLEHPISHGEFSQGFSRSKKGEPVFYYKDSVSVYLQSDTLQQMEATSRRMNKAGLENEDLKTWYAYNQMKINIVHQEENMQLFNDAVADLNQAKKLYNEFVQYRNNRFSPAKPDADIKAMFTAIENLLESSYKKMDAIGRKAENYQYDTDGLKENLDNLTTKVKSQKEFLKQYLDSPPTERQKIL
ncbi:MAG: hypothetical protein IPP72_10755 [Chitinophagaceae bacterium]|nr:hypothetical protein [Chitinophagaceae bacterium]